MARNTYRRLATLEAKNGLLKHKFIVWVNTGDGYLQNKEGMTLTR
jgi:hypothetical protein